MKMLRDHGLREASYRFVESVRICRKIECAELQQHLHLQGSMATVWPEKGTDISQENIISITNRKRVYPRYVFLLVEPQKYCDRLSLLEREPRHTSKEEHLHQQSLASFGFQTIPCSIRKAFYTFFTSLLASFIVVKYLKRLGKRNFVLFALKCTALVC